jgi:hypothetical protein
VVDPPRSTRIAATLLELIICAKIDTCAATGLLLGHSHPNVVSDLTIEVIPKLGVEFTLTAGPALERKGDVASYLTGLEPRSVFFVDEIHRLPRALEETFYPAMEDRRLPITVGQGAGAKVVTLDLPAFTLIGATTRAGLLTTPLRDRFGVSHRLDLYSAPELGRIVRRSAGILGVEIDDEGAETIASRSRGPPRPRHSRDRARAGSPACFSAVRVASRIAASSAKNCTASSRAVISSRSVEGRASRSASRRAPAPKPRA